MASAASRDEKARGNLRESNVDWLFCKYCKPRIYPASRALSLKSMASRLLGRETSRIDLCVQLPNAWISKSCFFLSFLYLSSSMTYSTHRLTMTKQWQSLIFARNLTQFPSASGYERNKIKRKRIVSFVLKEIAFFVLFVTRYIFEAGGIYEFCLSRCKQSSRTARLYAKLTSWLRELFYRL